MKERIIIVFVAVVIGLVLTTVGYLLYQSFQMQSNQPDTPEKTLAAKSFASPSPTPDHNKLYIEITQPKAESLTDTRTVTIKGTTNPGNTVVISSNEEDTVAVPKADGSFSTTVTIDAGANILISRAIDDQGNQARDVRTITFTSEDF